jgi:hypothetical protein
MLSKDSILTKRDPGLLRRRLPGLVGNAQLPEGEGRQRDTDAGIHWRTRVPADSGIPGFSGSLSPWERVGVRVMAPRVVPNRAFVPNHWQCHAPQPRPLSQRERGARGTRMPESTGAPLSGGG